MNESKEFDLTDDHLKLLRAANVRWGDMEWGAPEIDGKRPYGNSDLYRDIAKILEVKGFIDHEGEERWSHEQFERMGKLHAETEVALAIVLKTGTFQPGTYITSSAYASDWKFLNPKENHE